MRPGRLIVFLLMFFLTACMTYYQRNVRFYQNFESGNLESAEKTLLGDKKGPEGKNKLLYYLNLGVVSSMLGKYEESNQAFEQAYMLGEDYRKNYLNEVLAYLTNPMAREYKGEDFELLMIHYFKALNFLKMGENEKALVECRRMNNKLNAMSDKYSSDQKYKEDAAMQTLMGLIYEANGDVNNAFIAYRNAYNTYKEDYQKLFNLQVPEQLKKDLVRTAYLLGFADEQRRYEEEFGFKHQPQPNTGDLVFLWQNGLGPIKSEWSINFQINRNAGLGEVIFVNEEFGFHFPFPVEFRTDNDGKKVDILGDLSLLRVAFPKYIQRPPYYTSAQLSVNGESKEMNLIEDMNAIAVKTLRDRMVLEFGQSLMRLAIKKAQEALLRKEKQEVLATILSYVNAATEKADTRAWHTLPATIYYTRLSLPPGQHQVKLNARAKGGNQSFDFTFDIKKGQTVFHNFHSMEIDPSFRNYSYSY